MTWSVGGEGEGSQEWVQSVRRNRLKNSRWDFTVPREFESSRQVNVMGRKRAIGSADWRRSGERYDHGAVWDRRRARQEAWKMGTAVEKRDADSGWSHAVGRRTPVPTGSVLSTRQLDCKPRGL